MAERTDAMTLVVAGACVLGGLVVGLTARWIFGRLARRSMRSEQAWDDLWWVLLRGIALPGAVTAGVWWAAQTVRLRPPADGVVNRVLLVVVVLTAALALARLAAGMVRSVVVARSGVAQSASIFVAITRVVVMAIGVLVLLQSLGISITPLLTALGVGGLAVALALQDTLANVFAGIQVLASKKVQPGDFIRLDSGEEGYVVDINWRNTSVRQLGGNIVVVPNSRIADNTMINFHQPMEDMSVLVPVGVSYDSDLEHVERVTIEVARDVMHTVTGAVSDHEPFIRYNAFADSSINFNVILRAKEFAAQYLIVHEFIKRLHRRYREEGIEIPYPIRTLVGPGPNGSAPERMPVQASRS